MAVLDAFDLTGKVAVVTGGNTSLGEGFARTLSEAGARLREDGDGARGRAQVQAVLDRVHPMQRYATPEELGPSMVYLAGATHPAS